MLTILLAVLFAILPACETEDSANCAWNAATAGNGHGVSFVDVGGTTYPLEEHAAPTQLQTLVTVEAAAPAPVVAASPLVEIDEAPLTVPEPVAVKPVAVPEPVEVQQAPEVAAEVPQVQPTEVVETVEAPEPVAPIDPRETAKRISIATDDAGRVIFEAATWEALGTEGDGLAPFDLDIRLCELQYEGEELSDCLNQTIVYHHEYV